MSFEKIQRPNPVHPSMKQKAKAPIISPLQKKRRQTVQAKLREGGTSEYNGVYHTNTQEANKTGMPDGLKSNLETMSGQDLSGVRVHRNSSKPDAIQAHAYTQGQDIYLAPGQEKHLPHEGWHVVQQMQGRVQPTIQKKDALINNDSTLEREADVMGAKAIQMQPSESSAPKSGNNRFATRNNVIQRAMKFEYQFKKNFLYRDNGKEVQALPRKYGPRDYLIKNNSGARMESETHGQIEYETSWEKKWSKLHKQIKEIQNMSNAIKNAGDTTGSDGKTYKKFPFESSIKHLFPDKGFSMSNGRWNKTQKDGKAVVSNSDGKTEYENFRSTPSYTSDENIIQKIENGTKVFVRYFSSDRKWGRVLHDGKWGWIWSSSLSGMDTKRYESNKDSTGKYSDTPLEKGEKILVKMGDVSWSPYVQISESFKLEQYESYLEQYDKKFGASLISGTTQYLLEHDTSVAPNGETFWEKLKRQNQFLADHNKLKNFLLMVAHYIEKGRDQSTLHPVRQPDGSIKKVAGSAKYALNLLNRTHFGSIFKTLSKTEQQLFTQMVKDQKTGILPTMSLTKNDLFFVDGTGTGYNPKVYDWLISITQGGDILSVQSGKALPGAMGRFNVNEEKGKHEGLVRYEARNEPDNFPKLWDIDDHALRHFSLAKSKRSRAAGKGKTGLEW